MFFYCHMQGITYLSARLTCSDGHWGKKHFQASCEKYTFFLQSFTVKTDDMAVLVHSSSLRVF